MKNTFKKYTIRFSIYGLVAFILQELPYIPWLLWTPANNPLTNNYPATPLLGLLEQAGGILTIATLILIVHKDIDKPKYSNRFFIAAIICLAIYYISWICYFSGITNGWLIVIGMSAIVPIYYCFIALWQKNNFAVATSVVFLIGHTMSNAINFL